MILRKPYKFLIKNFRLIHLLLFIPVVYLIIRTNIIFGIFNSYVSNSYTSDNISNLAGSNVNAFMYLAVLLILGVTLSIYFLMKQKEKPTKLYAGLIIYYIALFIALTLFHDALTTMQTKDMASSTARAYRDISLLISLPQYFFAFYTIFRGLGFDIKSFKFESDLKDLDVSEEDNAEFEFTVGIETYKYKRTIRRFIREFRYYILENKFVFTCISAITGLIIVTLLYMHFGVYNRSYTKNHSFAHNSFNINVTDSMITTLDYNGKVLKEGKYYLVLQLFIANNSSKNVQLDSDNFRLQLDDGYAVPKLDRSEYFVDVGAPYNGEKIRSGTSKTYNLVYELDKKQVKRSYKIKILEDIDYKVGDLSARYKNLTVRPRRVTDVKKANDYNLKDKIKLVDSSVGDSTIQINDYEITDNYYYTYELCKNDKCREITDFVAAGHGTTKMTPTLLVLDTKLKLDKSTAYKKAISSDNDFYEDFITMEYDGIEVITNNLTPSGVDDKVVLQVTDNIKNAKSLKLIITIREKKYKIVLK